jgi:hypothetical protein
MLPTTYTFSMTSFRVVRLANCPNVRTGIFLCQVSGVPFRGIRCDIRELYPGVVMTSPG